MNCDDGGNKRKVINCVQPTHLQFINCIDKLANLICILIEHFISEVANIVKNIRIGLVKGNKVLLLFCAS